MKTALLGLGISLGFFSILAACSVHSYVPQEAKTQYSLDGSIQKQIDATLKSAAKAKDFKMVDIKMF